MEPRVLTHEIKGEGDPVVLVPGGLTGWVSWIPHAERLSARWRTIRVQPIHNELGSAGQAGDPSYTAVTERESLRMTLDALGIDSVDFAGWSGGGRALIEFVLEYPERVQSLALVEPAALWVLKELGEGEADEVTDFVYGLAGREVTEQDLSTFLRVAGFLQPGEDATQHPNWDRWMSHRMALSWQGKELDRSARTLEDLSRITCPVLLVKGTVSDDSDRRLVDVFGERIPNATVVELEGDHASHIQSIDTFLEAIEKHLASA